MERTQQHRFIDLAATQDENGKNLENNGRRQFLRTATAMAALTGLSAEAFSQNFDRYSKVLRQCATPSRM